MVLLLLIVTVWVPNAHKGNSYVREEWPPTPQPHPNKSLYRVTLLKIKEKTRYFWQSPWVSRWCYSCLMFKSIIPLQTPSCPPPLSRPLPSLCIVFLYSPGILNYYWTLSRLYFCIKSHNWITATSMLFFTQSWIKDSRWTLFRSISKCLDNYGEL